MQSAETVSTMNPACRHRSGCTERVLCSEAGHCCGTPKQPVVDQVPVPRKALDDLHAAIRFIEWADAQEGYACMDIAIEWLRSIGKEIFRD